MSLLMINCCEWIRTKRKGLTKSFKQCAQMLEVKTDGVATVSKVFFQTAVQFK